MTICRKRSELLFHLELDFIHGKGGGEMRGRLTDGGGGGRLADE